MSQEKEMELWLQEDRTGRPVLAAHQEAIAERDHARQRPPVPRSVRRPWRVEYRGHTKRWVWAGSYSTREKAQERIDAWAGPGKNSPDKWRLIEKGKP